MPRTTPKELEGITVRYNPEAGRWLRAEGARLGANINDIIRRLIDDAKGWFGLPPSIAQVLERDMKEQGATDMRAYVVDLLVRRYNELLSGAHGSPTKKK